MLKTANSIVSQDFSRKHLNQINQNEQLNLEKQKEEMVQS